MKRDCPTIQELLAFDAVARCASVTQAAEVLCISISAVSKQLAGLEAFLGCALLRKQGRGVQLTAQGQVYWHKIAASLRAIELATFETRSGANGSGVLTLASVPTFLTKWLIPRLPEFRRLHPGITLSFSQHVGADEALAPSVDMALRYGTGNWPGMVAEFVAGAEFVAVCTPALTRMANRLQAPADLVGHTLLHHVEAPKAWPLWAQQHAVSALATQEGPRFAQYSAIIQAALSSLGVALVPMVLVQEELASGSLVRPCGDPVAVGQGHYLCYRAESLALPRVATFRAWVLGQVQST